MHVSRESAEQTGERLERVLRDADFDVLDGTYAFEERGMSSSASDDAEGALALVRDGTVWSALLPRSARAHAPGTESLRVFAFHFPAEVDNSGFVGWLGSHLKAALGTGVLVVCGFNGRRGGIFDYWCVPESIGDAAVAEVRHLRARGG